MAQEIKLMADYAAWPLWTTDGNVDPATLPLSEELQARLDAWAEAFDASLNPEDPRHSKFPSAEAGSAFNKQGRALWHDLQHELGSEYVVCYFSEEDAGILFPNDEAKAHSAFQGPHGH